jgi:hypothetical protein
MPGMPVAEAFGQQHFDALTCDLIGVVAEE